MADKKPLDKSAIFDFINLIKEYERGNMKKFIFTLVILGVIVSQSIAYDVCNGDFLEKYEWRLETYEEEKPFDWSYCEVDCKKIKKEFERIEKNKGYNKAYAYSSLANSIKLGNKYEKLLSSADVDYYTVKKNCGGISKQMKARWELYEKNRESFFMGVAYRFVIGCEIIKPNQEQNCESSRKLLDSLGK